MNLCDNCKKKEAEYISHIRGTGTEWSLLCERCDSAKGDYSFSIEEYLEDPEDWVRHLRMKVFFFEPDFQKVTERVGKNK